MNVQDHVLMVVETHAIRNVQMGVRFHVKIHAQVIVQIVVREIVLELVHLYVPQPAAIN